MNSSDWLRCHKVCNAALLILYHEFKRDVESPEEAISSSISMCGKKPCVSYLVASANVKWEVVIRSHKWDSWKWGKQDTIRSYIEMLKEEECEHY